MTISVPLSGVGPRYQQLYRSLRKAIHDGFLPPGTQLPSTRTLCADLGVSRKVVLMAFARLRLEGYVSARVGSGTYVTLSAVAQGAAQRIARPRRAAPVRVSRAARRLLARSDLPTLALKPPRTGLEYDFRVGVPDPEPLFAQTWQRLVVRHARTRHFPYAPSAGSPALRAAIADQLAQSRGIRTTAEQIVILNGAQQGLDLISRLLLDPGDYVAIERLHYRGARDAFIAAGARIVPLPIDEQGLRTDRLPSGRRRVRLVYATPSHQFPTGGVLPLERRLALLHWAERTNTPILEDDYDAEFRYGVSLVEPLKALDEHDRVFYLNTFSKLLFPALRIAYAITPTSMIGIVRSVKWLADRHTPLLEQEVLTEFIADGHLARHARRARIRYDERRRTLIAALERTFGRSARIQGGRAGVHLLLWLTDFDPAKVLDLTRRAYGARIGIDTIESCSMTRLSRTGLVLGYQGIPVERIDEGVRSLASVIHA